MNLNLEKKAILIVAIILFLIISINTTVLTLVASNKYKKAILSKTSVVGEALQQEMKKVLSFGISLDSIEGISEKLYELVKSNASIGYAMVTDTNGTVIYDHDGQNIGKRMTDEVSLKAASSKANEEQIRGAFYDLSFPLFDADEILVGTLRVGVKIEAIRSQLYALLFWAIGVSCLCFLISIALVNFFISRFITRPIIDIEKAAQKIASGELTHELELKGNDEIALLGKAINSMAFNLRDIISKIRTITDSVSYVTSNIASSSKGVLKIADDQKHSIESTAESVDALNNSIISVASSSGSLANSAEDTSSAIAEMKRSIESVAESANIVDDASQETSSSIEEMVTNIKQIAESLESLYAASDQIATSIDEVNTTVKEIEERATESVGLAENVSVSASEKGINAVNQAMRGIENIKNSVNALAESINSLGKRSGDIGKILKVINDVTDQTTLLSLNAAILAAQAGEHGKSFAVVADSIKNLADKTSSSTKEIADLIAAVQNETNSSIQMAAEGIKTVEEGLERVQGVNAALSSIIESSDESTTMSRAIQRATSEQSTVIKQITDSIKHMSDQVEHISLATQEQNKGSKFIIETTERLKEISHQVKLATTEQQEGSIHIIEAIENITKQVDVIAKDTQTQKTESGEIIQSIDVIKDSTNKLVSTSNDMSSTVNSLKEEADNLLSEIRKFKI
jgi:methyl-accepting chemotaxis protein